MLLRASGEMTGETVDVKAVTDDAAAAESGVAHAAPLLAFADALVGDDTAALDVARASVRAAVGDAGLADAASVASNFERMVRIADGTGIPIDTPVQVLSEDVRAELGLGAFHSAGNTPEAGPVQRALGPAARVVATLALKAGGALQRLRGGAPPTGR